eukprot:980956-Amphidinium_carterae.1
MAEHATGIVAAVELRALAVNPADLWGRSSSVSSRFSSKPLVLQWYPKAKYRKRRAKCFRTALKGYD